MPYRPWGQLDQVLDRCDTLKWDLFGTISTEDRCLAVRKVLSEKGKLGISYMAQISDIDSHFRDEIKARLEVNRGLYQMSGGTDSEIHRHDLFISRNGLYNIAIDFLAKSSGNVILDISSLPKRFFFPILKIMLRDKTFTNFVVCYTIPKVYRIDEMSEDFGDWLPLPLFEGNPDSKDEIYFVGAGHMAMGLPQKIQDAIESKAKVRIFIPFPGHPNSFKRMWEFVRDIKKNLANLPTSAIKVKMVSARDVSELFDHLVAETENGNLTPLFAPYGPKPMSLAMCLFACCAKKNPPVYYTQPHIYAPDYSSGIAESNGKSQIYAYYLRLNGTDLYTL
jgi:hypothetical protein